MTVWVISKYLQLRFTVPKPSERHHGGGQRQAAERRGIEFDEEADAKRAETAEYWAEERSKGLFATSRVSDDGMIDPRDTRTIIAFVLSTCHNGPIEGTKEFGTWRM